MSLLWLRPKIPFLLTATHTIRLFSSKPYNSNNRLIFSKPPFSSFSFSTTSTPYPLQYDMIINTPTQSQPTPIRRRLSKPDSPNSPEEENPEKELGFDSWVEKKLTSEEEMDKSKRKYYRKRRKRMYGPDSEDEGKGKNEDGFVELKRKVVEFDRLHEREEELYFYDRFAYPWEKDKHYKMVYQLEYKYFRDQCFDKAFLEPGESNEKIKIRGKSKKLDENNKVEDKGLVFFEEDGNPGEDVKEKVTEKKVEEFFKCLKFPLRKPRSVLGSLTLLVGVLSCPRDGMVHMGR